MITYTWKTENLFTVDPDKNNKKYVAVATVKVTGTDGTYSSDITVNASFKVKKNDPNYIPFENLKNDDIVKWVQDSMSKIELKNLLATIDGAIESQVNPPEQPIYTPLPFN